MSNPSYEIGTGHVTIETKYDGRTIRRVSTRAGRTAGSSFMRGFFGYGMMGQNRRFRKMMDQFSKPINRMQALLGKVRRPALFAGIAASILTLIPTVVRLGSAMGAIAVPATLAWYTSIFMLRGLLGKLQSGIKGQLLKALNDVSGSLKEIAREAVAPGLNAFFEEALSHAPILERYVRQIGGHMSDVGFAFEDLLNREANIRRIKTTLDGTARATGMWYSLLDEAAEVILVIAAAGTPLFERFTRSMLRVGHTIHDWVLLQEQTGALQRHLEESYKTLEQFGRGGRDFLIGLFNIINGGVFGAEKVGASFEKWGAAFREWTEHTENIEKIRRVIAWFTENVGNFFRLAAAATAMSLALKSITGIEALIMSLRTMLSLGPLAFVLFGIGTAVASLAGGLVVAYTHSEKFRDKVHALFLEIKERLGPVFADWFRWIRDDLMPALEEFAVWTIEHLSDALGGLMTIIEDNAEALKEWRPIIMFLMGAISRLTTLVLVSFIEELGGLIQILGWVGRGIGLFRKLIENMPGWIGTAIDAVVGWFTRLRDRAGEVVHNTAVEFRALPGKITGFLKNLPGALSRLFDRALDELLYIIGYNLGSIIDLFVRMPGRVLTVMDNWWDRMFDRTKRDIGSWVDFFARLPGRVMRWFDRTWDSAYDTTSEWFRKIGSFISDLPGKVANWLVKLLPKVKERFSEAWQGSQKESSNRVAKLMAWVGQIPGRAWKALVQLKNRLVNRFAEGWAAATGTSKTKVAAIINFILGIPGRAFNALRQLAAKLRERASTGWQAFRDAAAAKVTNMITWVGQIPERIRRGLGAIGTKLRESGRQLIQGFLVGVQARVSEIGGLGSWFKRNLVDPVVNSVKKFFGIKSPSRVFQGIGMNIVAGLFKGLAEKDPKKFITKIFGGMDDALIAMVQKGMINISSLPQKALAKLGGMFEDLFGLGGRRGGGGSFAGLVGFARLAWDIFAQAFGLPMGGWRARGSVPGSDHPKGKAIDIMTTNPALHQLIIALGRSLPGAKYWISMRRIASAPDWRPRPYSGPSPHTDHVHWSFYRHGKQRLPEDIVGFGRSGRGYVMHKGEQVVRRNQTFNNRGGDSYVINVTIDAKNVRDFNRVVDMVQGLQSSARQMGVQTKVA